MAAAEALVFDAIRTPRGKGKFNGSLHGTKPVDLVVGLMHETLVRNEKLDPSRVDDVVLGCVSPVGDQGADIAKTAAIKAGLPDTVAGVQLNRFCASGLEAVNVAAQKVASGWEDLVLAGDWTDNGLNAGCIEAATISGLQAANAVLGRSRSYRITGPLLS